MSLLQNQAIPRPSQAPQQYLGHHFNAEIDRPVGSHHPEHGFCYPINYGFLPHLLAADGEGQDVYVLGVAEPVHRFSGQCIAIIERLNDDEDKLVLAPSGQRFTAESILAQVHFQEQYFQTRLILAK